MTDVTLSWERDDFAADGYAVWWVASPQEAPAHEGNPAAFGVDGCLPTGTVDDVACIHVDARPGPATLHCYEIRGRCGGREALR